MNGQRETAAFITCPVCQFRQELIMPVDACLIFHRCDNCRIPLRPLVGDCCLFCSYGETLCIPRQNEPGGDRFSNQASPEE
jgi:hypothetical protein